MAQGSRFQRAAGGRTVDFERVHRDEEEVIYVDLGYWANSGSIHPKEDPVSWGINSSVVTLGRTVDFEGVHRDEEEAPCVFTRWTTDPSSKVNLPDVIDLRPFAVQIWSHWDAPLTLRGCIEMRKKRPANLIDPARAPSTRQRVCAYICVCVCVCVCVCLCVCIYMYIYIHTYIHEHLSIYLSVYLSIYLSMCIYIYIYIYR